MISLSHFNGCSAAFFDRHGGNGKSPYAERNISYGVGDDDEIVVKNRESVREALGVDRLISANQVHGDKVFCYTDQLPENEEIDGVDALMTQEKGVGLMIQQADCQAVLIHDPAKEAIAAIHCGWRGSVNGIIGKTIDRMRDCFGTLPADLRAAVSPSLGPCCAEFINWRQELPEQFLDFRTGDRYFDFWRITGMQLLEAGVPESAVTFSGICTVCSRDYFSYRRACRQGEGITGRNCSVIALRQG